MANPLAVLFAAGTLMKAYGQMREGRQARKAGELRAEQLAFNAREAERLALRVRAVSQRRAAEELRQGRLVASANLARAAASGASVSDPTVVKLLADAEAEFTYRANIALFEGEAEARRLRVEAALGRVSGAQARLAGLEEERGARFAAIGSVLTGGASLYSKYGGGGPSGDSALIED